MESREALQRKTCLASRGGGQTVWKSRQGASLPGYNHNHEEWQSAQKGSGQGPDVCEVGGTYLRPWYLLHGHGRNGQQGP